MGKEKYKRTLRRWCNTMITRPTSHRLYVIKSCDLLKYKLQVTQLRASALISSLILYIPHMTGSYTSTSKSSLTSNKFLTLNKSLLATKSLHQNQTMTMSIPSYSVLRNYCLRIHSVMSESTCNLFLDKIIAMAFFGEWVSSLLKPLTSLSCLTRCLTCWTQQSWVFWKKWTSAFDCPL